MYELEVSAYAERQFEKLTWRIQDNVIAAFREIRENPLSGKLLGGNLSGQWSIRVGVYRILYKIFPRDKKILVKKIEHRATVYG